MLSLSENIAKSFGGWATFFDSHCRPIVFCCDYLSVQVYIHCVSKKTSRMFLAITRESIVGFS